MTSADQFRREYGLDWLRVIAFAILIGHHTGMSFVPRDWNIKNPERSESLAWVMVFFNRWRRPLLFRIPGAGVGFWLRRRSDAQLAGERLRRLPLLKFGIRILDGVHFQQHGSRRRMWIPPEVREPRLLASPGAQASGLFRAGAAVAWLMPLPAGSRAVQRADVLALVGLLAPGPAGTAAGGLP